MNNVFLGEIKDWDTWGEVFQSISLFKNLIIKIFEKENLEISEISNVTPGTNAVFKVGNYIIKIFVPIESGYDAEKDYFFEITGMKRAMQLGINIPNLIATSEIKDKYLFRYIIMDYINGKEAKDVLKKYSLDEKINFVKQLKSNLNKMNTSPNKDFKIIDIKEKALKNNRWNILKPHVVNQIKSLIKEYKEDEKVYVHGDITSDNVIIDENGKLYIIDFADGTIASKEYELPPILFDLFDFDKDMIKEFIGNIDLTDFIEKTFYSIFIHEFGIYFIKFISEKLLNKRAEELNDISEIKVALYDFFIKNFGE